MTQVDETTTFQARQSLRAVGHVVVVDPHGQGSSLVQALVQRGADVDVVADTATALVTLIQAGCGSLVLADSPAPGVVVELSQALQQVRGPGTWWHYDADSRQLMRHPVGLAVSDELGASEESTASDDLAVSDELAASEESAASDDSTASDASAPSGGSRRQASHTRPHTANEQLVGGSVRSKYDPASHPSTDPIDQGDMELPWPSISAEEMRMLLGDVDVDDEPAPSAEAHAGQHGVADSSPSQGARP